MSHNADALQELAAIFLGPKAENADLFERLLLEAFRDHVFWRRNVHPEDGFLITDFDKHSDAYQRKASLLSQELMSLLARLKGGVPFFSPRYIGHMTSDLTMASLIGYFATMLYNPNNIAAEASPVTTRLELEVADDLAKMVGYELAEQWGHLTSGGTVANFEAAWVARNLKYVPLAAFYAARELHLPDLEVELADGSRAMLLECSLWQLLNLRPRAIHDLAERLVTEAPESEKAAHALARHSLARVGYQEYGRRLAGDFGDSLPPAVVLVPSTAHYSWEKVCRALGIGSDQLVHVPVDRRFRMDTEKLWLLLRHLAAERRPVLAVVGVLGTTEESAIDRIDEIVEIRERAAAELGLGFYLHIDAAWGGYVLSVTREEDGTRRSYSEVLADSAPEAWPEEGLYRAFCAVEHSDSITIDPHKLGFVPYPAGAISFADRRGRELVASEAPYVFHEGASEWAYIGRYIFEGSKPGASAAGVWLSHQVLPLNAEGHGRLVHATVKGARALHRRLAKGEWAPFTVLPLPDPDVNIVCFAVAPPGARRLEDINLFATRIYEAMSAKAGSQEGQPRLARDLDYFVTKTILRAGEYGHAADAIVEALGFTHRDFVAADGLGVIRCTVMDPFLGSRRGKADFIEGFAQALRRTMERVLTG